MSTRLLTADELAERWRVPKSWIYAKTRTGEIPKAPLPGRYFRYVEEEIARFERGELESTPGER